VAQRDVEMFSDIAPEIDSELEDGIAGDNESTTRTEMSEVAGEQDSGAVEIGEVDRAEYELFHNEVCELGARYFPDMCFAKARDDAGNSMVVITQKTLMFHRPFGFTSRVQITIRGMEYEVHVMMKNLISGTLTSVNDVKELCRQFCVGSGYKFCPGIDPTFYHSHYFETIRFDIKSVRRTAEPFDRVDSVNCKLWFLLASNATAAQKAAMEVQCPACKRLVHDLNCQRRCTSAESPSRKLKRQLSSSQARLSYMSSASWQKRKCHAQSERSNLLRKVEKFSQSDVTLTDEQHDEMCAIVEGIRTEELEKIFLEGSEHGVGDLMREIWYTDSKRQKQQFLHDQSKNGKLFIIFICLSVSGARGNRWSMITVRIGQLLCMFNPIYIAFLCLALAVYTRSPAAYEALKSFGILQLPSRSTLQAYTGAFMHEPGASSQCIERQVARYVIFKEQCREAGKQEPKSDGVLIFDEVKVACQLMWNSRSHQLMGLAMTPQELPSLNDIYRLLKEPDSAQQTSYILQFLWRDLTSEFDIVGPYFTTSSSMEGKFIMACVLETVKLFQFYGMKTSLLVCDGASSNVSAIKASHRHNGAYSVAQNQDDIFEVKPWMVNPFNPPHRIYWLICPSHQVRTNYYV